MSRDVGSGAPAEQPRLVGGPARTRMEAVHLDLGEYNDDLQETRAEVAVDEGALIVRALHPEGDPRFRAMPNEGIEQHVRLAMRALVSSSAIDPIADADGCKVHAEGCIVYPAYMDDLPSGPPKRDGILSHGANLATFGVAAVLGALMLVAAGMADPLVLLLVPGVGMGALALVQARRRGTATMTSAPGYEQHLRRGRAQAMSISRAANRARGLST